MISDDFDPVDDILRRIPDLDGDILGVLRRNPHGCMTYYVANVLGSTPRGDDTHLRRAGITVPEVRRVLIRLERDGLVKRVPSTYRRMIKWALA